MYKYKKEFFAEWMTKNKIKREEIKRVLNTSSGNNLQLWLGEREPEPLQDPTKDTGDRAWLPLRHILKLCNHYGLLLSDFIENAEEPEVKQRRTSTKTTNATAAPLQQQLLQERIDHLQETKNHLETIISTQAETIQSLREQLAVLRRDEWDRNNKPNYVSEPLQQPEAEKSVY